MSKKKLIISVIVVLCAACAIAAVILMSSDKNPADDTLPEGAAQTQAQQDTEDNEADTEVTSSGIYEVKNTPSDEAADDALYAKLAPLNTAVNDYFNLHRQNLISSYGFMYSLRDNFSVSASDIASTQGIQIPTDMDDYTDIILIKPSDLAQTEGISLMYKGEELKPFTVYNSSSGYVISSADEKGGIITADQYRALLGKYSPDHGNVSVPAVTDSIYADIMRDIYDDFEGDSIDVKYIANDSKYASVVAGSLTKPDDIREYVLTQDADTGWHILLDSLESSASPKVDANSVAPDMEPGLMPKYTIASYGGIKTGFADYEQSLVKLGMLTQEDLPETYSCGAGRFAYIETASGKKLLGIVNDSKQLEFYEVNDNTEAIAAMLKVDTAPPVFILDYSTQ